MSTFDLVAIDHGVLVVKPSCERASSSPTCRRELEPARFAYFAQGLRAAAEHCDYAAATAWIEGLRAVVR